MTIAHDPCKHWSVFRMLEKQAEGTAAQFSILTENGIAKIYCCESIKVKDLNDASHVLCAGIELNSAIDAQGHDSVALVDELQRLCVASGGSSKIPPKIKKILNSVARILNINWIARGIEQEAQLICVRGAVCPRKPSCYCNQ